MSLLPSMGADGEAKTKPIQHSIKQARCNGAHAMHTQQPQTRGEARSAHSAAVAVPCGAAAAVGGLSGIGLSGIESKWDPAELLSGSGLSGSGLSGIGSKWDRA